MTSLRRVIVTLCWGLDLNSTFPGLRWSCAVWYVKPTIILGFPSKGVPLRASFPCPVLRLVAHQLRRILPWKELRNPRRRRFTVPKPPLNALQVATLPIFPAGRGWGAAGAAGAGAGVGMAPSGGHLLAPSLKASLGAADDSLFAFDTQGAADAVIQARLPALQLAEAARKRYHEGRRARRARKLRRRAGYGDAEAERARRLGGGDDADGSDDDDEASAPELEEWGDDERPPDEMRVVIEGTDNVAAHRRHAAVEGVASG